MTDDSNASDQPADDEAQGVAGEASDLFESAQDSYEDEAEKMPEHPSVEGEGWGSRAGDAIGSAVGNFAVNSAMLASKVMPASLRMWKGLLKASYKGVYKSSDDIDAIGHIMVGGEIKHVPVTYDHEKEQYQTLSDDPEWWDTHAANDHEYRVGPVPAIWASSSANDVGSAVQADVAEALDIGQDGYLYEGAQVNHVQMLAPESAGMSGDAVADGGHVVNQVEEYVSVQSPGKLSDRVVDLSIADDADARVVSMDKYHDTYPEKTDSEKMQRERQIGRLMETDGDGRSWAMKMLLIAVAGIVLSLAIVVLGPMLLGSAGGGGGGGGTTIIPGLLGLGLV